MGTYIYGYTKKEKTIPIKDSTESIQIGMVKYVGKPSFWRDTPNLDGLIARYESQNEGRELPRYICVEDLKGGKEVYDFAKRKQHEGVDHCDPIPTFYDYYGFGPHIGDIIKVGNRLKFKAIA